jgi:hypothetical protein
MQAALAARETALDERERAITQREDEFEASLKEARDNLHEQHAHLVETHRQLVHRIMSCSGILGEWNWNLQSPPSWEQLRKMIANLPADLPAASPAEVISENAREDWSGNVFVPGSTLTRSIREARHE